VTGRSARYERWIVMLAALSLLCVAGIVWGELANNHLLVAKMVGVILLAYSFILLLLRKGGLTGV